jgi:hypothetical protein
MECLKQEEQPGIKKSRRNLRRPCIRQGYFASDGDPTRKPVITW